MNFFEANLKYNNFLFDLDDTLLNFQASEKLSLDVTIEKFNIPNENDIFFNRYKIENDRLWKQIETGEITKDYLKIERFQRTLDAFDLTVDPEAMSDFYLTQLPQNVVLNEGAVELCRYLKNFGTIAIITNGMKNVQHTRINNSLIKDSIDFICVSEECGAAKPDPAFFEYTMNKISGAQKEKTIIIGDRLEADIKGANNYGIDSCWFNPHRVKNLTNIKSTYEINNLIDLIAVLNN